MYFGSGGSSASDVAPELAGLRCGDNRLSKKLLLLLLLLSRPTSCCGVALFAAFTAAAAELGTGCIHAGADTAGAALKPGATGCCLAGMLLVWLKVGNGWS